MNSDLRFIVVELSLIHIYLGTHGPSGRLQSLREIYPENINE